MINKPNPIKLLIAFHKNPAEWIEIEADQQEPVLALKFLIFKHFKQMPSDQTLFYDVTKQLENEMPLSYYCLQPGALITVFCRNLDRKDPELFVSITAEEIVPGKKDRIPAPWYRVIK